MKKIISYILIIILVILLIFITYKFLMKRENNITNNNEDNEEIVQYDSYKYKHYEYIIPSNIDFTPDELTFKLNGTGKNKWEATVSLMYDNKKVITNNPERVKQELINGGYEVTKVTNEVVNEHKYLIIYCNKDLVNHYIAYMDTDIDYGYEIDLIDKDTSSNIEILSIIDKIIYTAKYDGDKSIRYNYYGFE